MFSGRKNSESEKIESERSGLAVSGSPAPIHVQQPIFRDQKQPKHRMKDRKRKEFSFPVDKIIYLAERLEVMSLTERKIGSIALSTVDLERRGAEPRSKEDHPCGISTSGLDFSLDLSSISNGDESDDSGEEMSFRRDSKSSGKETTRPLTVTPETNGDVHDEKPKRGNCDLINVYVNAVENQDLVRYFRPCRACKEPSCVCPNLTYRSEPREEVSGYRKVHKAVETDVNFTRFECSSRTQQRYRDFDYCCPEIDFFLPSCEEECPCRCTCRNDRASNSASDDSERIRHYTSGLAQATRSARALVRDLEIILHTMNGEMQ